MSNANTASQTAYSDLNWARYNQHRPPYPPSLKDLVLRYHVNHGNPLSDLLVDVGSGVGIASIPFFTDFKTVHLLDPSAQNIIQARVFLNEHVRSHDLPTDIQYTAVKAEEGHQHVKGASVAVCAAAAHFIDPESLITSMAGMIAPGGTLAIYTYWSPAFPDQSPELTLALGKALNTAFRLVFRPGDDLTPSLFANVSARLMAGNTILDFVPIPEDLFKDAVRIQINPTALAAFEVYRNDPPVPCEPLGSQVKANEEHIEYHDGKDPEAEGWSLTVDLSWLHGFLNTVLPADIDLTYDQRNSLHGELDKIFASECPSGSARALFAVSVLLATRRLSRGTTDSVNVALKTQY